MSPFPVFTLSLPFCLRSLYRAEAKPPAPFYHSPDLVPLGPIPSQDKDQHWLTSSQPSPRGATFIYIGHTPCLYPASTQVLWLVFLWLKVGGGGFNLSDIILKISKACFSSGVYWLLKSIQAL